MQSIDLDDPGDARIAGRLAAEDEALTRETMFGRNGGREQRRAQLGRYLAAYASAPEAELERREAEWWEKQLGAPLDASHGDLQGPRPPHAA